MSPTAIEWTEETWNPVTGCSRVSPGCAHCYAETLSLRFGWSTKPWHPEHAAENVVLHPGRLEKPLSWRKPKVVFVNSMSDCFHEQIPGEFLRRIFDVMARTPQHTYQILTKRPERARDWLRAWHAIDDPDVLDDGPLENVWLGVSIENDRWVERADVLREIPAAVRFISAEPLLGPLPSLDLTGIDWLIVGGESGHDHRPMDPEWARALLRACQTRTWRDEQGELRQTAFFFKQWGGRTPKAGGRLLDGRTWDEMPVTLSAPMPGEQKRGPVICAEP